MAEDDRFTPRIGRLRSRGEGASKRYLSRIRTAIEKAKPNALGHPRKRSFTGTRLGRGAGIGHVAAWRRSRVEQLRLRRAVVKLRVARIGVGGMAAARAHLNYVTRDGVTRDGAAGSAYDASLDQADGTAFLGRAEHDRHQFRLIVAPEDSEELARESGNLKEYTREFMARVQKDLGTRLDWVAVDHFDTDHPHTHIVIRGKDDTGKDLILARDYIAHGLRSRAGEVAQDWLGPRPDRDIAQMQAREVEAERLTGLDRDLLSKAEDGFVTTSQERGAFGRFRRALLIGRLETLERLGLTTKEGAQHWRLSPEMEQTLRRLGERGDIIRTMQRALGADREPGRFAIFDPSDAEISVVGRIAATGAADETKGTRFVVIDGADTRQWYVDIGGPDQHAVPPVGAIVALKSVPDVPTPADQTIDAIARAHDGRYDDALHMVQDPSASAEFRRAHIRRLEALRRVGIVSREADGSWRIPDDYLTHAAAFGARRRGAQLQILSWLPLEDLAARRSATWLDQELEAGRAGEPDAIGFAKTSARRSRSDAPGSWRKGSQRRGRACFWSIGRLCRAWPLKRCRLLECVYRAGSAKPTSLRSAAPALKAPIRER